MKLHMSLARYVACCCILSWIRADNTALLAQALTPIAQQSKPQEQTRVPSAPPAAPKKATEGVPQDLDDELAKLKNEIIEVLPTQIKISKNTKLKITLPLLGPIEFTPFVDEKGDVQGLQAQVPQGKPFEWGNFKIEKGLFKIVDGKLSYTARATIFGKSATIGLQDFSLVKKEAKENRKQEFAEGIEKNKTVEVYRLTMGVVFDEGAWKLELIPGKKIEWKTFKLIIEQGKGISLLHEADVLGQPADLSIEFDSKTKQISAKGEIKKRPVVEVVPELKGSLVDGLFLEGNLIFNAQQGLIIKGSLQDAKDDRIAIAGIMLNEAHIDINLAKKHALVSGKTTLVGLPLEGYFALFFGTAKAGAKFAVEIPSPVEQWQPFKESTIPELRDIKVHSLKAGIRAQYVALTQGTTVPDDKQPFIKNKDSEDIFAALAQNADDVVLTGQQGASLSCFIAGKSTILNMTSEVILKLEKQPGKPTAVSFVAGLPQGWKISQSFPSFKPTGTPGAWNTVLSAIELFKIDHARIIASTHAETIESINIEPGFNLVAGVTIDGTHDNLILKILAKGGIIKLGERGATFQMVGTFNPSDPKNLALSMGLSSGGYGFNIGKFRFDGGQLNAIIRGKPSISFAGIFTMKPSEKDTHLSWYMDFFVTPIAIGVSASMKNVWKNPFGIPGFEFGNLGGEATQTWTAIEEAAATGGVAAFIPATFGLTGHGKLGSGSCEAPDSSGLPLCFTSTINIGKDITNFALVNDITNPIDLATLTRLLVKQMGGSPELVKVFDYLNPIRLKRGKFYFVPFGTTIGEIKVRAEIGLAAYFDILGKEAHVDGSIGLNGLTLKGKLPAFDIGIITMSDFDESCNKEKKIDPENIDKEKMPCGPTIDIQANTSNVHLIIDGLMKFGPVFQSRTKWYVTLDGIKFETQTFVGPAAAPLGITIKGSSISFKDKLELIKLEPKDLFLDIEFQNQLNNFIATKIENFITERKDILEKDINDAIAYVARLATEEDLKRQHNAIAYAESRRVWFKDDPLLSAAREADVVKEKAKLELLKAKLALEKTDTGQFVRKALDDTGLARLMENALRKAGALGAGALSGGTFAFTKLARAVVVRRMTWHGTLADLGKGVIPGLDMELEFGGQVVKRTTPPFNLLEPVASANMIAQQVAQIVVDGMKAALQGTRIAQSTKDLLEIHIAHWNEHGKVDAFGNRYDDDWSRGQWLLSELEKENPAAAQTLKGQLLPGPGCWNLSEHIAHWSEKGYDGDVKKGQEHLRVCRIESPAFAEILAERLANISKGIGSPTTEGTAQRGIASGVPTQAAAQRGITSGGEQATMAGRGIAA